MRTYFSDDIIPYEGIESFRFGKTIEEVRATLKEKRIPFNQTVDQHKGCTPEVPWTFIELGGSITLCFVKEILFEVVLEKDYEGALPNGIKIGTTMGEATRIDESLQYNEDDEDFISKLGYWIEEDPDSNSVASISVFVREAEDKDEFFKYEWIKKYDAV